MDYTNAINYKSKKMEIERLLNNLKLLGLNVSDYFEQFKNIDSNCKKEIEEIESQSRNVFTDTCIDNIYSKYLKMLRDLMYSLSDYNKLFRFYELSLNYIDYNTFDVLTEENIAIYVNDAIREINKLLDFCNFNDPNCDIFLKKILPSYLILIKKEFVFQGQSLLLDFIENVGLGEILRNSVDKDLDELKLNPSSFEKLLESDPSFSKDIISKLDEQYEKITSMIDKSEKIDIDLKDKKEQFNNAKNKKKEAKVTRLVATASALVVLISSFVYTANKGIKAISSTKLYQTTKESYSTVDGVIKTSSSYEEKIPSNEKILVVSYTPWEEYMKDNYSREVVTADVSDIDFNSLADYVNLDLANLNNVTVETERQSNVSLEELYSKQITEVIRMIQNPNNYIIESDNFVYKFSLAIVLLSLLLAISIVKFSLLFAGITDSLIADIAIEIINRLKIRNDCNRLLKELDNDMMELINEYSTNNQDIDVLMQKFRQLYDKYYFLIKDNAILEKYNNLIREKKS